MRTFLQSEKCYIILCTLFTLVVPIQLQFTHTHSSSSASGATASASAGGVTVTANAPLPGFGGGFFNPLPLPGFQPAFGVGNYGIPGFGMINNFDVYPPQTQLHHRPNQNPMNYPQQQFQQLPNHKPPNHRRPINNINNNHNNNQHQQNQPQNHNNKPHQGNNQNNLPPRHPNNNNNKQPNQNPVHRPQHLVSPTQQPHQAQPVRHITVATPTSVRPKTTPKVNAPIRATTPIPKEQPTQQTTTRQPQANSSVRPINTTPIPTPRRPSTTPKENTPLPSVQPNQPSTLPPPIQPLGPVLQPLPLMPAINPKQCPIIFPDSPHYIHRPEYEFSRPASQDPTLLIDPRR